MLVNILFASLKALSLLVSVCVHVTTVILDACAVCLFWYCKRAYKWLKIYLIIRKSTALNTWWGFRGCNDLGMLYLQHFDIFKTMLSVNRRTILAGHAFLINV